jgi:hypothetical protein
MYLNKVVHTPHLQCGTWLQSATEYDLARRTVLSRYPLRSNVPQTALACCDLDANAFKII